MSVNKQQEFQMIIEKCVSDNLTTYMDALSDYMESNDLDAKQVAKLISPILHEKIRIEVIANKLITDNEPSTSLPL